MSNIESITLSKPDGHLRAWFQQLRKAQAQQRMLHISQWRASANANEMLRVLHHVSKAPDLRFAFLGNLHPRTWSTLNVSPKFPRIGLEREMLFHSAVLSLEAAKINEFIVLEKKFCGLIFNSDFDGALKVLDEVRAAFGMSVWELENRLFLLKQLGRSPEQSELVSELRNSPDADTTAWLVAEFYLIKLDPDSSPSWVQQILDEVMKKYATDGWHEMHLNAFRAVILPWHPFPNDGAANFALWSLQGAPLIDRYLTLLQVFCALQGNSDASILDGIKGALNLLVGRIDDQRLLGLADCLGLSALPAEESTEFLRILDAYTEGDYAGCLRNCISYWHVHPGFDELVELAGRTIARLDQEGDLQNPTLGIRVAALFAALVRRHKQFGAGLVGLQKLSLQFARHPWALLL
jgi:hypothetical protein